jgi:hypothetical protein
MRFRFGPTLGPTPRRSLKPKTPALASNAPLCGRIRSTAEMRLSRGEDFSSPQAFTWGRAAGLAVRILSPLACAPAGPACARPERADVRAERAGAQAEPVDARAPSARRSALRASRASQSLGAAPRSSTGSARLRAWQASRPGAASTFAAPGAASRRYGFRRNPILMLIVSRRLRNPTVSRCSAIISQATLVCQVRQRALACQRERGPIE